MAAIPSGLDELHVDPGARIERNSDIRVAAVP
jgi:hypothetical protein